MYPIPSYPSYLLSEDFRVWSCKKKRFLKGCISKDLGYIQVELDGKTIRLHSLIAVVFHGPCPYGMEVRHKDDNKLNNNPDNLCYGTKKQNREDARKNGKLCIGSRCYNSKLTEEQILEIRNRLKNGETKNALALEFNMSYVSIFHIERGRTWRHVQV